MRRSRLHKGHVVAINCSRLLSVPVSKHRSLSVRSHLFRRSRTQLKAHCLRAQPRMLCRQVDRSRSLFRHESRSPLSRLSAQTDYISHKFRRSFHGKDDRIVGICSDRSELIRHAKNHASRIGTIGHKFRIIWMNREFAIDPATRERLRDHLLPLDETIDPKVPPSKRELSEVGFVVAPDKGSIDQMAEFRAFGV